MMVRDNENVLQLYLLDLLCCLCEVLHCTICLMFTA